LPQSASLHLTCTNHLNLPFLITAVWLNLSNSVSYHFAFC